MILRISIKLKLFLENSQPEINCGGGPTGEFSGGRGDQCVKYPKDHWKSDKMQKWDFQQEYFLHVITKNTWKSHL